MLAKEMLAELHEQLSDQAQGEDGNIPREQYRHILGQRFSEEQMASIADKIDCDFPADLQEMLINEGPIQHYLFGKNTVTNTLHMLSFAEMQKTELGIISFIKADWGGLPELNQPQHGAYCSEQDQALLNENYFVFGYYLLDEQAKDYFYFDRHGDIGVLEFNRDDTSDLAEIWQALCEESLADMGLAEMLQVQIDCISLTMDM